MRASLSKGGGEGEKGVEEFYGKALFKKKEQASRRKVAAQPDRKYLLWENSGEARGMETALSLRKKNVLAGIRSRHSGRGAVRGRCKTTEARRGIKRPAP